MYCSDFLSPIKWQYRAQPGSQFELPSDGHCVGNNYFIWCHNDARLEPHFKDVKILMAATHIKNGDDGGVVPTNDVWNIFGLWDLGGYQL